jgi:hypothetical protein
MEIESHVIVLTQRSRLPDAESALAATAGQRAIDERSSLTHGSVS